jgi:hypothetical protein
VGVSLFTFHHSRPPSLRAFHHSFPPSITSHLSSLPIFRHFPLPSLPIFRHFPSSVTSHLPSLPIFRHFPSFVTSIISVQFLTPTFYSSLTKRSDSLAPADPISDSLLETLQLGLSGSLEDDGCLAAQVSDCIADNGDASWTLVLLVPPTPSLTRLLASTSMLTGTHWKGSLPGRKEATAETQQQG